MDVPRVVMVFLEVLLSEVGGDDEVLATNDYPAFDHEDVAGSCVSDARADVVLSQYTAEIFQFLGDSVARCGAIGPRAAIRRPHNGKLRNGERISSPAVTSSVESHPRTCTGESDYRTKNSSVSTST